jgi:hypothetical protein
LCSLRHRHHHLSGRCLAWRFWRLTTSRGAMQSGFNDCPCFAGEDGSGWTAGNGQGIRNRICLLPYLRSSR